MLSLSDYTQAEPCPPDFNLAQYVLARGAQTPDKTALSVITPTTVEHWSYARLIRAVLGTGSAMRAKGLNSGDRVLLRLGNTPDFPIAYLGAIAADLVPVPTSAALTESEVAQIISDLFPRLILRDAGVACPQTDIPIVPCGELRNWHDADPVTPIPGDPERAAYIVYTSGTSGRPRAVEHAHRAIWARRMMIRDWYELNSDDRLLHAGAFNWTYTLGTGLLDPWTTGATALITAQGTDIAQIPNVLKQQSVTIFAAVPGVYRKILNNIMTTDIPSLRHCVSAGEKLSESLRDQWRCATRTEVYEAYGMSECSTFISASPSRPAAPGAIGCAQRGRALALVDERGEPVARGNAGIIAIHGDDQGLMRRYVGAEEETEARFRNGWFLTGDLATMRDDGQLIYQGRADDMMNAGGYRVSPLEVEAVLNAHPDITQAAVTDIEVKPDVRLIMAFYTGRAALEENDLRDYVTSHLASYKVPRSFFHTATLPTNPNGKLQRAGLRRIYEELHGQT